MLIPKQVARPCAALTQTAPVWRWQQRGAVAAVGMWMGARAGAWNCPLCSLLVEESSKHWLRYTVYLYVLLYDTCTYSV
jgi:hypothetical protein